MWAGDTPSIDFDMLTIIATTTALEARVVWGTLSSDCWIPQWGGSIWVNGVCLARIHRLTRRELRPARILVDVDPPAERWADKRHALIVTYF